MRRHVVESPCLLIGQTKKKEEGGRKLACRKDRKSVAGQWEGIPKKKGKFGGLKDKSGRTLGQNEGEHAFQGRPNNWHGGERPGWGKMVKEKEGGGGAAIKTQNVPMVYH